MSTSVRPLSGDVIQLGQKERRKACEEQVHLAYIVSKLIEALDAKRRRALGLPPDKDEQTPEMLRTFSENLLGIVAGMHLFRQYLQGKCGARVYACWMHVQMFYQTRDPQRRTFILADIKRLYLSDSAIGKLKKGLAQELLVVELLSFEMVPADVAMKDSNLCVDASEVDLTSNKALRRVHSVLLDNLRSYWVPCYVMHVLNTEPRETVQARFTPAGVHCLRVWGEHIEYFSDKGLGRNKKILLKADEDAKTDDDGGTGLDRPDSSNESDDEFPALDRSIVGMMTKEGLNEMIAMVSKTKDMSHMTHLLLHYVFGCRDLHMAWDFLPNLEDLLLSPDLKKRLMDDLGHNTQSSLIFATQDVLSNVLTVPATQYAVNDVVNFRGVVLFTPFSTKSAKDEQPTLTINSSFIPANPWADYPASKIQGDFEKVRVEFSKFKGSTIVGVLTEQHRLLAFQYLILASEGRQKLKCLDDGLVEKLKKKTSADLTIEDATGTQTVVLNHLKQKWFPKYLGGWQKDEQETASEEGVDDSRQARSERRYSQEVGGESEEYRETKKQRKREKYRESEVCEQSDKGFGESEEHRELKKKREPKKYRDSEDSGQSDEEYEQYSEPTEHRDSQKEKKPKKFREFEESDESKEYSDSKELRESKKKRESKKYRESEEPEEESRESKEYRESKKNSEPKKYMEFEESDVEYKEHSKPMDSKERKKSEEAEKSDEESRTGEKVKDIVSARPAGKERLSLEQSESFTLLLPSRARVERRMSTRQPKIAAALVKLSQAVAEQKRTAKATQWVDETTFFAQRFMPKERRNAIFIHASELDTEEDGGLRNWDMSLPASKEEHPEVKVKQVKKKPPHKKYGKASKNEKRCRIVLDNWKFLMAMRSVHNVLRKVREFTRSLLDPVEGRLFQEYLRREVYRAEMNCDGKMKVEWSAHLVYFRKLLTRPASTPGAKPITVTINKLPADLRFWLEAYK
nr:hypothetical protein BaRGS_030127 [Batillaria attramentaria]